METIFTSGPLFLKAKLNYQVLFKVETIIFYIILVKFVTSEVYLAISGQVTGKMFESNNNKNVLLLFSFFEPHKTRSRLLCLIFTRFIYYFH